MILDKLRTVVELLSDKAQAELGSQLKGVLHYGTSVNQVKSVSDIDLIFLLEAIDSERKRFFFDCFDKKIEPAVDSLLDAIRHEGYHYELSPNPVGVADLEVFKTFHLDLADRSRVVFDPEGLLAKFIEKIQAEIQSENWQRVQHGAKWYWRKIG